MIILKKILGAILIVSVLLPMFLFLNPFAWGMRRAPVYTPPPELEKALEQMRLEIAQVEDVQIDTYNNEPNLWYLRDCKNEKLDSLANLNVELSETENGVFVEEKIRKFEPLLQKEIDCKCYDSLIFSYWLKERIKLNAKDSLAQEYNFENKSQPEKIVIGFKIKKQ